MPLRTRLRDAPGIRKDLSLHSVEDYTELKHVYVDLTEAPRKGWHYITYGKP